MDAEFLTELGYRVITSDISLGAAKRAAIRARRRRLPIVSIVADVEHLPLRNRSIQLVYVHDGLHHIKEPMAGLAEILRVASLAVSVTEPARSSITAMAVRLGLARDWEESGNRVARMALPEAQRVLTANGFHMATGKRYAMYYKHQPGLPTRLLSRSGLFQVATTLWRLGNSLIGRAGNKLAITGVRD
jgi:SAM-dependent methyltransferase